MEITPPPPQRSSNPENETAVWHSSAYFTPCHVGGCYFVPSLLPQCEPEWQHTHTHKAVSRSSSFSSKMLSMHILLYKHLHRDSLLLVSAALKWLQLGQWHGKNLKGETFLQFDADQVIHHFPSEQDTKFHLICHLSCFQIYVIWKLFISISLNLASNSLPTYFHLAWWILSNETWFWTIKMESSLSEAPCMSPIDLIEAQRSYVI